MKALFKIWKGLFYLIGIVLIGHSALSYDFKTGINIDNLHYIASCILGVVMVTGFFCCETLVGIRESLNETK